MIWNRIYTALTVSGPCVCVRGLFCCMCVVGKEFLDSAPHSVEIGKETGSKEFPVFTLTRRMTFPSANTKLRSADIKASLIKNQLISFLVYFPFLSVLGFYFVLFLFLSCCWCFYGRIGPVWLKGPDLQVSAVIEFCSYKEKIRTLVKQRFSSCLEPSPEASCNESSIKSCSLMLYNHITNHQLCVCVCVMVIVVSKRYFRSLRICSPFSSHCLTPSNPNPKMTSL